MATTSLWHIKGRLGDLIDYVENPEKTVPKGTEDFFNVFEYVRRTDKTNRKTFDIKPKARSVGSDENLPTSLFCYSGVLG